jgi:hypothetical protein
MLHNSIATVAGSQGRSARSEGILLVVILAGITAGGAGLWWMNRQETSQERNARNAEVVADSAATLLEAEENADKLDPGWRFQDLQARRAKIPDASNGALAVLDAGKTLTIPWSEEDLSSDLIRLGSLAPLSAKQVAALKEALAKNAPPLREASRLADLPTGRYPEAFTGGICGTPLLHLETIVALKQLLFCDALKHIHDGDLDAALRSDRALLNSGRSIGDEPTSHSQLIRASLHMLDAQALERILAHGQPSDAAMKETQLLFEDEGNQNLLLQGARGLRAGRQELMQLILESKADLNQLQRVSDTGERALAKYVNDYFTNSTALQASMVRKLHAWLLNYLTYFVAIAKLPQDKQPESLQVLLSTLADCPKAGRILVPELSNFVLNFNVSQVFQRCSAVALALERYRQAKGAWPESLNALVPSYLSAVPLDPFDGKPLRYRQYPGEGVVVYSIGTDGKDNEGKFDSLNTYRDGTDIGIRLWNVDKRLSAKR